MSWWLFLVAELLADHTTLRVGGPARSFRPVTTDAELIEAVGVADQRGEPVLLLGGGSNLVIGDVGFDGVVIKVATSSVRVGAVEAGNRVEVKVAAGVVWDDFVADSIARGFSGLEAMSGIPGLVGATPIQNVGAYGAEVSQVISWVRVWDRLARSEQVLSAAECGFSYRHSRFKSDLDRWVVLEVGFSLQVSDLSAPIRYAELARVLGVAPGERAGAAVVREAVLRIRSSKGMMLDERDHDTWSAGSFFTNPIVDRAVADRLPENAPRFEVAEPSQVKLSAAWLIQQAGFTKGYGSGAARLSNKHVLALTNRGGATAAEVCALADEIRTGVYHQTGIVLVNEPVLINCGLTPLVARSD